MVFKALVPFAESRPRRQMKKSVVLFATFSSRFASRDAPLILSSIIRRITPYQYQSMNPSVAAAAARKSMERKRCPMTNGIKVLSIQLLYGF